MSARLSGLSVWWGVRGDIMLPATADWGETEGGSSKLKSEATLILDNDCCVHLFEVGAIFGTKYKQKTLFICPNYIICCFFFKVCACIILSFNW